MKAIPNILFRISVSMCWLLAVILQILLVAEYSMVNNSVLLAATLSVPMAFSMWRMLYVLFEERPLFTSWL